MFTRTTSAKLASISLILFLTACGSDEKMMPPAAVMAPPPPPMAAPPAPPPPPPPARPPAPVQQSIVPGSLQDFQVNVGDRVFFDYDRSDLDDRARGVLQKQAAWLQRFGAVILILEGHADERGTREYNLALGARRAQSVKDYLASRGIEPSRMRTISYGKERPVAVCNDISCWSQNRRAVTVLNASS